MVSAGVRQVWKQPEFPPYKPAVKRGWPSPHWGGIRGGFHHHLMTVRSRVSNNDILVLVPTAKVSLEPRGEQICGLPPTSSRESLTAQTLMEATWGTWVSTPGSTRQDSTP